MTIQAGDILSYNGEKITIVTEPLKPYLESRSDISFIFNKYKNCFVLLHL